MGGSITDSGMISRGFTPTELHAVIRQAETLLGASLDDLVQSYRLGASSLTPPKVRHRFVELLLRLRSAADRPDDPLAQSAAAVSAAEARGVIDAMAAWQRDPVWPEVHSAIKDPANYLHAVTTLPSSWQV